MVKAVNVNTHPDFTIDEFIDYTGWEVEGPIYKRNMQIALEYFQAKVPRMVLRKRIPSSAWSLKINGESILLTSWMQGINFRLGVNPNRFVQKGNPLIAFKDPNAPFGQVRGNWFTFPSTQQEQVAIHTSLSRMHKFKALASFSCMQSSVADAHVAWLQNSPAEYQHGGAAQLFIWEAQRVLEPV